MSATAPSPPDQAQRRSRPAALLALMRPRHWAKNAFVLAPLFFSEEFKVAASVLDAAGAFAIFCLCSSAVYALNDYRDRAEDRLHPLKRTRPLATGELRGRDALAVAAASLGAAAAIGIALGLPGPFWAVMGGYLAINAAYSLWLRHIELVDVCVIAAGFVLRVLAGTTALGIAASQWIVLAAGLLALLLAIGKRRVDLGHESAEARRSLSGYSMEFIDVALAALAASVIGFYALFTLSDYALARFGSDQLYLTTFPVVIGILRYLQLVIAHGRDGSPTDIALEDRPLQAIVLIWAIAFALIAYV